MNEEERLEMLKNTGELKYLTKECQLLIWDNNEILTWANYTVDKIKSLQQENTILKENAKHNDEVVDNVNWENTQLKQQYCERIDCCGRIGVGENHKLKILEEKNLKLEQQLKDKDELLSQIYEYVNVDNHLGLDMSSKEQGKRIVRDCVLNMF